MISEPPMTEQTLDQLQRAAFSYFLQAVNPANGLIADTTRDNSPASIGASLGTCSRGTHASQFSIQLQDTKNDRDVGSSSSRQIRSAADEKGSMSSSCTDFEHDVSCTSWLAV